MWVGLGDAVTVLEPDDVGERVGLPVGVGLDEGDAEQVDVGEGLGVAV